MRLDMEEWQRSKTKVSTTPEEASAVKESTLGEADDQTLMEDLDQLELEARRMEKKMKGDNQERRPKRRKLDKLVGWGDELETTLPTGMETWSIKITTTSTGVAQDDAVPSRLEEETTRMLEKAIEITKKQSEGREDEGPKKIFYL